MQRQTSEFLGRSGPPCGWRVLMRGAVGLPLAVWLSCAGNIEEEATTRPAGQGESAPNKPMAGETTNPAGAPPAVGVPPVAASPQRAASAACKAIDPGPAQLRRLNRLEYNNSIRDLLGDNSAPAVAFPPEALVHGFDNDALSLSASPALTESYVEAAERLASNAVDNNLGTLVGCDATKEGDDLCARKFFENFGKRAYRRPLNADDLAVLTEVFAKGKASSGFKGGIRAALTTMLGSAHFLYRVEFGMPAKMGESFSSLTPYELASRLSYLLWRSMPDGPLFVAAGTGKLLTREDLDAQITRMMADPKARNTVSDFHEQWLRLGGLDDIKKDSKVYPAFRPETASLMKQETLKFVDAVVWEEQGTLSQLYTAPFTFANATLSKYYGLPAVDGPAFRKVPVTTQARAGILTQGSLLSILAQENQTHPIRRGAFVRKDLLCQDLPPPPENLEFQIPLPSKMLTGRERFVKHREDPACSGCHTLTDPIGFGFETFDGVGLYRTMENSQAIDASGDVIGLEGGGKFNGPAELGTLLAKSPVAADCMVVAWFRYGYGRDMDSVADACSVDVLKRSFASTKLSVKDLIVSLAKTDAFQYRRVVSPGGPQ